MEVAVLGCGNMASAIVSEAHRNDQSIKFYTYTPSQTKALTLAKKVSGKVIDDLSDLPKVDLVLIACKPQQVLELSEKLKGHLNKDQHLVSILAATDISTLQAAFDCKSVTRIMPNTPCSVGEGISLCLHAKEVNKKNQQMVEYFFGLCSEVIAVKDDSQLDLLTVVSGSGPAYVYEFAQGMEQFLVNKGVEKEMAIKIINQLFIGSSILMKNSTQDYTSLVDAVTSKAGVTIEAIRTFREMNLSTITSKSLENALSRSDQISRELRAK